jgi:acyl-CoA reductase-like NAD-dependent aldehyde dehydrogenase
MNMEFFNIINGEKRSSQTYHQCTDPRTEKHLWDAPIASPDDLDEAVKAARIAQLSWKQTTVAHRQSLLQELSKRLETHRTKLVATLMRESGKSVSNATRQL